jgi:hypothetical protein
MQDHRGSLRFLLLTILLGASAIGALPSHAQQGSANRVGPNVSSDQLSRDSTQNPNRATGQISVGPTSCSAGPISWTQGGQTCDGNYPGGAAGSSVTVQDSNGPTVGVATATCTAGVASASGTCSIATSCAAQALSWTVGGRTCTANAPLTASGSSIPLSDTAPSDTGNAVYVCNNGTFTLQAGATCNASSGGGSCPGFTDGEVRSVTGSYGGALWGSNPYTYDSSLATAAVHAGLLAPGQTGNIRILTNGTLPSYTGSTANGVTSAPYGSFCGITLQSAGGGTAACSAQGVTWSQGADTCTASYPGGAHGTSASVNDSTAPTVGSGTSVCSNGVVSTTGTCSSAAFTCSAGQVLEWVVNSRRCTASSSGANTGSSISVAATGINTGNASFVCNAGGGFTVSGSPTCNEGGTGNGGASCASLPAGSGWQASGFYCSVSDAIPVMTSGRSLQVVDATGVYQGNATIQCNNGVTGITNASCAQVSGASPACAALSGSWAVGGNTCVGSLAAADLGMIASAVDANVGSDGGTAGATGSSDYQCTGSGWVRTATPNSCALTAVSCPGEAASWIVSGNTCGAMLTSRGSGQSLSVANTNANRTGNATYLCQSNGVWALQPGATCNPVPANCPDAGTQWWGIGSSVLCASPGDPNTCCSANFPALAHAGSTNVTDSTAPTTGNATSTCADGARSYSSYTCSLSTPSCPAVPANIYRESDFACNVGPNTYNASTPATPQGSTVWMTFQGSSTQYQLRCSNPTGPNYGYVATGAFICN